MSSVLTNNGAMVALQTQQLGQGDLSPLIDINSRIMVGCAERGRE